ncbi:MAG: hypothetical protein KY393_04370, partial [Actinobacteria bacterium]|nr:hypothetical protein [Actinomycetota bacterium]
MSRSSGGEPPGGVRVQKVLSEAGIASRRASEKLIREGRVHINDKPAVLGSRIDPETGEQTTYAEIPDLPQCGAGEGDGDCEPSSEDSEPWPNWPVFDEDGNLYVTDLHQATIWRIPPRGQAQVWHQSADYDSIFSLNGQQ